MLYSRIEGSGKPLVIMHGFLGMSDNWKTLSSQYAASGFEVHALDLRNHGRSFHSESFTYHDMVNDLLKYLEAKNLTETNLLGHSMGGKVAMFFATAHPAKTSKLIVADIAPKYYGPHHDDIMAALNAVDFSANPDRNAVEEVMKPLVPDFGTRQFLMKNVHRTESGKLAFRFNLKAFNENLDIIGEKLEDSQTYNGPALFLKGDKSNYIRETDMPAILHHFPNAEIKTISNSGHWLHAENPKEFFQATLDFLK